MAERGMLLNRQRFAEAVTEISRRDHDLAAVVQRHGPPSFGTRKPGFPALVAIIIEQQVSVASGRSTFARLQALLPQFTPQTFLHLPESSLRGAGLSRQKIRYTRLSAEAVLDGSLPLSRLQRYDDARVRGLLTAVTGIGDWTADVYLLSALRRADVWPVGDLALAKAFRNLKGLPADADGPFMTAQAEHLRPLRSVAARICWRHYLLG